MDKDNMAAVFAGQIGQRQAVGRLTDVKLKDRETKDEQKLFPV